MRRQWWDSYRQAPKLPDVVDACECCNGTGRVTWSGFLGGIQSGECRECDGRGVRRAEAEVVK